MVTAMTGHCNKKVQNAEMVTAMKSQVVLIAKMGHCNEVTSGADCKDGSLQ
jgi:hypothetical protein